MRAFSLPREGNTSANKAVSERKNELNWDGAFSGFRKTSLELGEKPVEITFLTGVSIGNF